MSFCSKYLIYDVDAKFHPLGPINDCTQSSRIAVCKSADIAMVAKVPPPTTREGFAKTETASRDGCTGDLQARWYDAYDTPWGFLNPGSQTAIFYRLAYKPLLVGVYHHPQVFNLTRPQFPSKLHGGVGTSPIFHQTNRFSTGIISQLWLRRKFPVIAIPPEFFQSSFH